jgi:hypothetical protein
MKMGMGMPIPDLSNLPGSSRPGGGGTPVPPLPSLPKIDNLYSFKFDGVKSMFQTDSITLGINFTFSLWIKANSFPVNPTPLGSKNYFGPGFNGNFIIRFRSDQFLFASYNSNNTSTQELVSTNSPSITTGQWYHIAFTNDGSTAIFYLNGSPLPTTGVNTKPLVDLTNGLIIGDGDQRPAGNDPWDGYLDEIGVFNTALTQEQIESIYNATTTGKTADLSSLSPVAWYRMGD